MDNATLISTVATRLNRTDLTALIPDFIARAEDEIFAKLSASPVRPMQTVFTNASVSTQTTALPSNFIDAIDLTVTDGTDTWKMVRLGIEDDADYYATRSLPYRTEYDSSKIRHYWIVGSQLWFPDTPEAALSITLRYFAKPTAIAAAGSNWVSTSHADVYEFGSLMHAARHIRDDDLEDRLAERFATAIGLMLDAYPEQQNPGELRAADAPWANYPLWNITHG